MTPTSTSVSWLQRQLSPDFSRRAIGFIPILNVYLGIDVQPQASLRLYSADKLFATVRTILVSFPSASCVFRLSTLSGGDVSIYPLPTHRAKTHRSSRAAVIQVGTTGPLHSHLFLLKATLLRFVQPFLMCGCWCLIPYERKSSYDPAGKFLN